MAAFANAEVIASKRTLAVMTSHAAHTSARGMVVRRLWCGHLPTLRHTGTNIVTFRTG
ncbi:MAG TPA: hypothetical protein VJ023_11785 [Pyrinomonadaceae bacterium]|nr:hypothetical protein [Pyrinomonadaceae bacterium]